ncbi:Z1 domain-containing protein [Leifsonia sp. NPDC056824]|uniref:Z1 domain-containing protein n=1 Tax=Leifsonia sp. NPDC056824 TaxID=3345953 RepID=UPI003694432E
MTEQTIRAIGETSERDGIVIGNAFTGFLERVAPEASRASLHSDATTILKEAGVTIGSPSARTGLVVGRVQSGKTLSYESVIALARDSGFALVVVVSGISNPLLNQGVRRLKQDLTEADENGWSFLVNPSVEPQDESTLRSICDNWGDPTTPPQLLKTAVCLLLKNWSRIEAFQDLCSRMDWSRHRVLIIDDEADQASLNVSFRRNRESTTYRQILELRNLFPNHAYLQYTATPQAPLLLAITDTLAPDFVRVLEPGTDYVGGPDYFGHPSEIVHVIGDNDLILAGDPNGPPPRSLVAALREFTLGAAHVVASGQLQTRSMLVHPSRLTTPHATFVRWIRAIVQHWKDTIEDGEESDCGALQSEFHRSWQSLAATDGSISGFEACWLNVRFVLRNLQLIEMNSRDSSTPVIEWDTSKAYVLVGGQALDRGFTLDGLSVTYMPRDPGGWTADTIQQRARFFGYKRKYFGQCRVYLEPDLRDAFEMYVEHERYMLNSLRAIQSGTTSLKEWERQFYLDPSMRATRQSVTSLPTVAVAVNDRWIYDPRVPTGPDDSETTELELSAALAGLGSSVDEYGHTHTLVPLPRLLEIVEIVPQIEPVPIELRALKLHLARLADEQPAEVVRLIRMRPGLDSVRTVRAGSRIEPFQGRSATYPGDRALFDPARLTVQVHRFRIRESTDQPPSTGMVTTSFWTPVELAGGWLLEE